MNITGEAVQQTKQEEAVACEMDSRRKGMLVVLSANTMGTAYR